MNDIFDEDDQTIDPDGYFYQDEDGDACMTSTMLNYLLNVDHADVMQAIMQVHAWGITKYYRPISLWVGVLAANEIPRTHDAYLIKSTGLVLMAPYLNLNEHAFNYARELAGKFLGADELHKDLWADINKTLH